MLFDPNSEFGAHVAKRLREDEVIWLTAVRADGVPQPNPVWFLWNGQTILIFSQSSARKVKHIAANPKVALNFNTGPDGGDVVVVTGEARIETATPSPDEMAAYVEKYRQGIADIGMTPESMGAAYSIVIRVTPRHIRGF